MLFAVWISLHMGCDSRTLTSWFWAELYPWCFRENPPPPKKKNKTTKRSKREGGGGRERAEGNSWIKDERNGCFSCCVPVLSCLFCLLPWILLKEWELHFQFSCPTWDTLLQLQVSNCNTAANRKMEAKIRMSSPCPHATKVSLWWVTVQHIPKNFSKRELPDALSQAS